MRPVQMRSRATPPRPPQVAGAANRLRPPPALVAGWPYRRSASRPCTAQQRPFLSRLLRLGSSPQRLRAGPAGLPRPAGVLQPRVDVGLHEPQDAVVPAEPDGRDAA